MIAPELFKTDPLAPVQVDPDYASARFIQPRRPPPSYKGIVVSVGHVRFEDDIDGGGHFRYGLGYSPTGESPLLVALRAFAPWIGGGRGDAVAGTSVKRRSESFG